MSRMLALAIAVITLLFCASAFPLAANHPPGLPVGQNPEWPAGLADLLNSPGRVHGYFVNANDFFFYREDTDEFNRFIEQYAGLEQTPLTLVLQPGPGTTNSLTPDDKELPFDWEVDLYCRGWAREAPPDPTGKAGKYVVVVKVFPAGQFELGNIRVPPNVKVKSGVEDKRFAEFIAAHEAKQEQAKEEKTDVSGAAEPKDAAVRFIDLDPYVTAPLEAYHGGDVGSDLPLEPGKQRIGESEFRVGKGVIQLAGSNLEKFPKEVKGIKVALKLKRLRVLHSCSWDAAEGTRIGGYIIHYGDGTTLEIPIEYGVHVKDWWADWGDTPEVSGAEVAWTSGNPVSPPVRLYCMTWENPAPDKVITTMDCVSAGTECAPFVVAMTAEGVQSPPRTTTTEPLGAVKHRSERPRYAKVALNQDASRALSLLFDESRGTGTGYDLLYADTNFDGRFEASEKLEARTLQRDGKLISSSFPPIKIETPYEEESGSRAVWQIAFGFHSPRSEPLAESSGWASPTQPDPVGSFHVTASLKLGEGRDEWRYFMSGTIRAAENIEKALVWSAHRDLKLEVSTRPDGRNKGNLGIALKLDAGENKFTCLKGGLPAKAHVEIKKPDGTVVHTGEETLDKFVFG
jgi:hypothetical protein